MKRLAITERDVLEACETPGRAMIALAIRFPDAPTKVIYAALIREDNRGHLEVGVSLASAWLTEKGRERLADIRAEAARIREDLETWPGPERR